VIYVLYCLVAHRDMAMLLNGVRLSWVKEGHNSSKLDQHTRQRNDRAQASGAS
jgi:hypothetical protein